MSSPGPDPSENLLTDLVHRLAQRDLEHVELATGPSTGPGTGPGIGPGTEPALRLRIDVVTAGQVFYWITFVARTDAEFDVAYTAKAAMRSFPWTMPFRPRLERAQASLPVLCRWQRAYVEDTAALCLTLLTKHFRVAPDSVRVSGGEVEGGSAKSQKAWLGEVTAWYMGPRA